MQVAPTGREGVWEWLAVEVTFTPPPPPGLAQHHKHSVLRAESRLPSRSQVDGRDMALRFPGSPVGE